MGALREAPPLRPLAPGTRLGRYLVIERIGEGAMGVVYKAYDSVLDRRVALKLMSQSSPSGNQRFLREAQTLARLAHPNVVTVHDAG